MNVGGTTYNIADVILFQNNSFKGRPYITISHNGNSYQWIVAFCFGYSGMSTVPGVAGNQFQIDNWNNIGACVTTGAPMIPAAQFHDYSNLHDDFYARSTASQYTYQLTTVGNISTLVMTDVAGNQFIYDDLALGIEKYDVERLSIAINPVDEILELTNSHLLSNNPLQIFDIQGRLISSFLFDHDNHYDVADLPTGLYYLQTVIGERQVAIKLVKR